MDRNANVGGVIADLQTETDAERQLTQKQALAILAGADLHGSQDGIDWFSAQALALRPELVVFLGDFVNSGDLDFVREVLRDLRESAPHCYVIPGNWDPRDALPLIDKEAFDGLRHLHKTNAALGGYIFAGLGGSTPTPVKTTPLEMPDDVLAGPLPELQPADIWLLHQPLKGHRDRVASGAHVGSDELKRVYREQDEPPLLVLSGHIHEARGFENNGPTTFVNPGSLKDKHAAWLNLAGGQVEVELLEG